MKVEKLHSLLIELSREFRDRKIGLAFRYAIQRNFDFGKKYSELRQPRIPAGIAAAGGEFALKHPWPMAEQEPRQVFRHFGGTPVF